LQSELKLSDLGTVKNALFFWNNLGVLRSLEGDSWKLVEEVAKEGEEAKEQVTHGELSLYLFRRLFRWANKEKRKDLMCHSFCSH